MDEESLLRQVLKDRDNVSGDCHWQLLAPRSLLNEITAIGRAEGRTRNKQAIWLLREAIKVCYDSGLLKRKLEKSLEEKSLLREKIEKKMKK